MSIDHAMEPFKDHVRPDHLHNQDCPLTLLRTDVPQNKAGRLPRRLPRGVWGVWVATVGQTGQVDVFDMTSSP